VGRKMNPENLRTKREYDVYIQGMKDAKEIFDNHIDGLIDAYKTHKKFCDEE